MQFINKLWRHRVSWWTHTLQTSSLDKGCKVNNFHTTELINMITLKMKLNSSLTFKIKKLKNGKWDGG